MSAVYLAMSGHRQLETVCVVKRLLPGLAAHAEHLRRFRHEADLARRLSHGNLVNTHNIGEVDGEVFLVQEFVEGQDVSALLDELNRRRRPLPVPIAVYIASEIARGLAYAHAFEDLQLVHRDINQPNVRLTYSGEVKLLDFGIASSNLHGERSGDQSVCGKLWHLAPEQLQAGGAIDRRTDIYAVGILLWEMLTGRPVGTTRVGSQEDRTPETEGEVMVWIMRGQHQAPSAFNPEVSPELDALVAKAMHVQVDQRYAGADELRRALAPFMASGFHPEEQLSRLLKELFSPEQERSERLRLIESSRSLLVEEGGPSRDLGQKRGAAARPAVDVERLKKHSLWAGPVLLGALVGTSMLFCLRARRPADVQPSIPPAAPMVAGPAIASGRPAQSSMSAQATAVNHPVTSAPPGPVQAANRRVESQAAPASPQPPARTVAATATPAATGTAAATTTKVETSTGRIDHLDLARQAFNARDWTRALAEAKVAVAAGGGADAHALIGNTYFKMGRFSDAESAYRRAVALDPKSALLQERLRIAQTRAEQAKTKEQP